MNFNEFNQFGPPITIKPKKSYGLFKFMFDIIMVTVTYGLWLIWIFVREMRRR